MRYLKSYKIFENNQFVNFKNFDLEQWYDKLNRHFFNGRLPKVDLRWNDLTTELGVVKWDVKTKLVDHLGISMNYKLTKEEVLSVLAHEMIHIWQIQNNKTDGHGNNFTMKMGEMNKKSKWGIEILTKQPMDHLKMNNPDLNKDFGFILTKKKNNEYEIATFDPSKTDHNNVLKVVQQNLQQVNKVDYEVRLTRNGVIKKYKKVSTDDTLYTYEADEVTFNTLMKSSKKIKGGTIKKSTT